jgi:pimeloyl-ACP methyl ester carboxylesterase
VRGPVAELSVTQERRAGYHLERLVLDLNGVEPVPALFVKPVDSQGRLPTILYHHAHGEDFARGKGELISGRGALADPPYADALTRRGYAALCIDMWGFGERFRRTETSLFKEMLWRGKSLWGFRVFDALRSIDYLESRADVNLDRLATMGISMGSTMAWWVAALDERVNVCIDLCCLTEFDALIETDALDCHGVYYYVPNLLSHFTTAEINALIAPRPHLSLAGLDDALTPKEGLDRIDEELRLVYASLGAADAWHLSRYDTGHGETAEMRAEVMSYLEARL